MSIEGTQRRHNLTRRLNNKKHEEGEEKAVYISLAKALMVHGESLGSYGLGGPGSLVGLHLGKRPNGVGGAGSSVAPPMGTPFDGGAEGVGVAAGEGMTMVAVAPLVKPIKPPVLVHVLAANGLFEATRFAAAPTAATAMGVEAATAAAIEAIMTTVCYFLLSKLCKVER